MIKPGSSFFLNLLCSALPSLHQEYFVRASRNLQIENIVSSRERISNRELFLFSFPEAVVTFKFLTNTSRVTSIVFVSP